MKKTIRIIAITVLAIMICLSFASCDNNKLNLDDDDEKTSYNGPNKDPQKAGDALKAAGYEVDVETDIKDDEDGLIAKVEAVKAGDNIFTPDYVKIYYFKDTESAKKAYEEYKSEFEAMKEIASAMDYDVSNIVLKTSGKIVYEGNTKAIKAAK